MKESLIFGALLVLSACVIKPAAVQPAEADENAKPLFCAYGSVSVIPVSPPPGFESQFAVAVVEINSSKENANVTVSDFALFDQRGTAIKAKRVISVEEFDEPNNPNVGTWAYYLNTAKNGHTRLWNGVLPTGRIRLRIRVAFAEPPKAPVRFRLSVGREVIEGPVDGSWPT